MHQGRAQAMRNSADGVASSLGWFSIGLGVAELVAPRLMARASGLKGQETLLRLYGAREIATGIGILLAWDRKPWVWARVAGDALDLATLSRGKHPNATTAMAAVAGVTALDVGTAAGLHLAERKAARPRFDYSDRSGFPKPAQQMRGIAKQPQKQAQTPGQSPFLRETVRP
jgi:hypothetical protein